MQILTAIGGIILALLVLTLVTFITVLIYFAMRKRHPYRKILNEFIIVGGAFLLCFVARAIIAFIVLEESDLPTSIANGMYLVYSTIGGLSFEGIDAVGELGVSNVLLQSFYYGAIAYAAITFLLIATTGVSYEFFTYAEMWMFRRHFDVIYVFTSVSEESLILAQDIQRKEREKGNNSFAILFIGNELEAFDRKDERHRLIMNNGFYYWSYSKKQDSNKETSLFKKLNMTKFVEKIRMSDDNYNNMVHVFALENDNTFNGAEGINSDCVFDDMRAVLRDYYKVGSGKYGYNIPTVINYYLLCNGDVNYEFYKTLSNEIATQSVDENWKEIAKYIEENGLNSTKKDVVKYLLKFFQLHIFNEAKLTANDMIYELRENVFRDGMDEQAIATYRRCVSPDNGGVYRAAVFGFGKNGQYCMKELYCETAYCNPVNYDNSKFIADVYDKGIADRSGDFAYGHPLFLCKNAGDGDFPNSNSELLKWEDSVKSEELRVLYELGTLPDATPETSEEDRIKAMRARVRRDIDLPTVVFHANSCFENEFMKKIDMNMAGAAVEQQVSYKAFIVCLGKDENNLRMANILLDDFKHEVLLNTQKTTDEVKIIFVNVRDDNNLRRLNWSEEDRQYFKSKLLVIPYGSKEKLWSYNNIIDDDKTCSYNYIYNIYNEYKGDGTDSLTPNEREIVSKIKSGDTSWTEYIGAVERRAYKDQWLGLDTYLKESNRAAYTFGLNYYLCQEPIENKVFYSMWEHYRWMRFYISNGWIYANYGRAERDFRRHNKEHTCLCPFDMLDEMAMQYDMNNVLVSKSLHSKID